MKNLHVINSTRNSNLAIYMGAYIDILHNLAILVSNPGESILYVIPYLKQMGITYKIYSTENELAMDIHSFKPDAVLFDFSDLELEIILNMLTNTSEIDVISVSSNASCFSEHLQKNGYFVTIFNPQTEQTTYIYHTNAKKNLSHLMMLNRYQTIQVEWQ